jgi:murein DD-endopeptidase MepM/ murein hydrolase activator NlpD
MLRLSAALLLALIIVSSGVIPARAQSAADDRAAASASGTYVDRRIAELRRLRRVLDAEQAGLRKGIAANAARRQLLTLEVEELTAVLQTAQTRLESAHARFARVQADLAAKDRALRAAELQLSRTVRLVENRAAAIYKDGPVSTFSLLFGARSFGDLMRRFAYVLHATHTDNVQIADMRRQKATILATRALVALLRDKAAQDAAAVRGERDRVAGVTSTLDSERAAVGTELDAQYARLGGIAQQKARFKAEESELQTESARIAAFLQGQSNTPPTVSPKGMMWPVNGSVTSGFGWRVHPVFHTRRFHSGVDISSPYGTAIHAAASGKVIFAGSETGYGNYVIVYHGGRIATLYAHMSSIGVSKGASVVQGGTIGRVGCTGYCTGPHVHFEVRVNGNPVDPMGWLP